MGKPNRDAATVCDGALVESGEERGPGLLVPCQGEGVGEEGCGVHVLQLSRYRHSQALQAPRHHGVCLQWAHQGTRESAIYCIYMGTHTHQTDGINKYLYIYIYIYTILHNIS